MPFPIQLIFSIVQTFIRLLILILTGRSCKFPAGVKGLHSSGRSQFDMEEQQQQKTAEIYTKYEIVAEQRLSVNLPFPPSANTYYNSHNFSIHSREWIGGTKWEFTVIKSQNNAQQCNLKLTLLETELEPKPVMAEVIFWQWHRGKQIYILQNCVKVFPHAGSQYSFQCNTSASSMPSDGFFNVLIRQLEKKQPWEEHPCPPRSDDDVVVLRVGPEQFGVSKHFLMSVSPVFLKMFTVDMLERAQGQCTLEDVDVEEFSAFLEAISPNQTAPNPSNVMGLLKLADRFQVEFLRNRCENHLINCLELSLIDRLLCSEMYRLEKLKNFILKSLSGVGMREFYEENQSALNLLSKNLLIQLTVRICSSSKIDRTSLCNNCAKNLD